MDIENENAPSRCRTEGDDEKQNPSASTIVDFPTEGNSALGGTSPDDRRKLLRQGYEPLPLVGKACFLDDWTAGPVMWERLALWEGRYPGGANTGLRCGKFAVADIDLLNPDHAARAYELVQSELGLTDFERTGKAPKVALCYLNKTPIGKVTVEGRPPGASPKDKPQKVEFLGAGQQLVCFGEHPDTRRPYSWSGPTPLDCRIEELPETNPAAIRACAFKLRDLLEEMSFTDVKVTGDMSDDRAPSRPADDVTPVTPKMFKGMFAYPDPNCPRTPDWIGWGYVIAETPLVDEDGNEIEDFNREAFWHDWSMGNLNPAYAECPKYDPGESDKAWKSLQKLDNRRHRKTVASLVHEATKPEHGYVGPTRAYRAEEIEYLRVPETTAIERLYGIAKAANDDIPDSNEPPANRWPALMYRGDAIASIKPPIPIIPGYLLSKGVTAALATRGHGKTVIVSDMALRIATDMEWCGERVMRGWHVVYLCGEDAENTAAHIQAWCKRHTGGKMPERFTFVADVPNLLARGNCDVDELIETVRTHIPEGEMVLWVVDTWQRATTEGGQNEDADMKPAFRNLEALAKSFDGAAIGCFHPPKDNAKTISGVAFQENATVGIWHIEKIDPDAADSERKLTVGRLKGRGEGNHKLFRFDEIPLGDADPLFNQKPTGAVARHIGGTGEPNENAIVREREKREQDAKAIEAVFKTVKGFLEDGKRVLGSNKGDGGNVVKLDPLAEAIEKTHGVKLGATKMDKRANLRGYLHTLTSKADGRLGYRDAHGKTKASYILK